MARRQTRIEVPMFPFLSVLCAVIGVLVLFIVLVLSTRVVVEDRRYRRTEAYDREVQAGRLSATADGIDEDTYQALQAELDRLRKVLAERQKQHRQLVRRLAALEDLLEYKETEILVPHALAIRPREFDKPVPVEVIPARGYEVELQPILVEVSFQGYTIHPSHPAPRPFPPIRRPPAGDGESGKYVVDAQLAEFLEQVEQRCDQEYLVFLIHPNGVEVFDAMREYLSDEHERIRVGWEPFSRDWVMASRVD